MVFLDEVEPGWEGEGGVSRVGLGGKDCTSRRGFADGDGDFSLLMWESEIYAPSVISILISGDSQSGITVSSSSAIRALSMDSVDLKSR